MAQEIPDVSRHTIARTDVSWHEEGGRVVIVRPKFGAAGRKVLQAMRVPPDLKVRLDPLGSEVWRLVEAPRLVKDVLVDLQKAHPDEDDLPQRFGQYIGTLVSNGLMTLETP